MKKNSKSLDSNLLFDLKDSFKQILTELEKEFFEQYPKILKLEEILMRMYNVAQKNKSIYFQKRISRLLRLVNLFKKNKGYDKNEFDVLYHLIGKIQKNDSIELLNESLKNRLEKISENQLKLDDPQNGIKEIKGQKYLTFRFQSVYFILENFPKKILKNVDRSKIKCKVEGNIYSIFPNSGFGLGAEERIFDEYCDLLILKTNDGFRCFHVDEIGLPVHFAKETFHKLLKPLEKPLKSIQSFIKWRGKRYYYISTGKSAK